MVPRQVAIRRAVPRAVVRLDPQRVRRGQPETGVRVAAAVIVVATGVRLVIVVATGVRPATVDRARRAEIVTIEIARRGHR